MNPSRKITTVLIAQDEQERIEAAIRSCEAFADEVLVLDGGSEDETVALARGLGCRVLVNPWPGYIEQRNLGASEASHDWIFIIDADEVVCGELATELGVWKEQADEAKEGYWVYRYGDFFSSRMIPDAYSVRLYDRRRLRFEGGLVHESVPVAPQRAGSFKGTIWHYGFRSVSDHVSRFNEYTDLEAQKAHLAGKSFSVARLLLRPPARFAQRYLLQRLYKEGIAGLTVAVLWTYYEFLREIKLYEIYWREETNVPSPEGASRRPEEVTP
jgi:glycosyltransferase involved in cell wall biosynthesis